MSLSFTHVAERGVLVQVGADADEATNLAVIALDKAIAGAGIDGLIETVPALVNIMVVFDPLVTDHQSVEQAISALWPLDHVGEATGRVHRVPVCYDAELSPDLAAVAKTRGMSVDAVIAEHVNSELRVAMFGFAPGFAYLAGVPEPIQVPRKLAAVRGVRKGSVMIAGPQCLITPIVMPTGWHVIGRTGLEVMDEGSDDPFLFAVGDRVVFERIGRDDLPLEMQQ